MTEESESSDSAPARPADATQRQTRDATLNHYWRANLRLILILLTVWFTVSFGFGILLVDLLNQFELFGFKLGFWWAQQGSIYVFVILIGVYVFCMHRIDQRHGVDDD